MQWIRHITSALLTLAATCAIAADVGVSEKEILIGQTIGITGIAAPSVKELNEGAHAYLSKINKSGGVHGRQIKLITYDDNFNPKVAKENAIRLISQDKVFALFLNRGTPHTEGIMPLLAEHSVPLIAPSTGASSLHTPVHPMVFNVRSKYQDEVLAGIRHFHTIGMKKIGVWYIDDSFGKDGLEGYQRGMQKYELPQSFIHKFPHTKTDAERAKEVASSAGAITAANPQVLILVAPSKPASEMITELRARGSKLQIMVLSNNASGSFIEGLGKNAADLIVSQIMPAADIVTSELALEFRRAAKESGITPTYASMEGFVAAKVLVEGLRRAGPRLSRAKFVAALETMQKHDLGGVRVDYSSTSHSGSQFVELTMIGKRGQYIR